MADNKIEIKSIDEAMSTIRSKVLIKIYCKFKEYFPKGFIFTGTYTSKQEILDNIEERMIETIQGDFIELKSKISTIRKTGQDITLVDLETLTVPLKLKVLRTEFTSQNLNKTFSILDSVKEKLTHFKMPED